MVHDVAVDIIVSINTVVRVNSNKNLRLSKRFVSIRKSLVYVIGLVFEIDYLFLANFV
jgi:hypothetical protein